MSLFTAFRRWLTNHAARKRATTYLVAALVVVMSVVVPGGTLTSHAVGLSNSAPSAQFVPSAHATTTPSITLNPKQGEPNKIFKVTGTGFAPNALVDLFFAGQLDTSVNASSSGTFTGIQVSTPLLPEGKYTVAADQTSSGAQAQALFTIIPAFFILNPNSGSDVAPVDPLCSQLGVKQTHTSLRLAVSGEPAIVPYEVQWTNEADGNTTVVANANTTTKGTLLTSFNIPAEPSGEYRLVVDIPSQQQQKKPTASYYSDTYSCFTYGEGSNNLNFNWDGVGWDANSKVDFASEWGTYEITANAKGSFNEFFAEPCPAPGTYQGTISGTIDGGQPFSMPLNPPITVDNNCGCAPICAPSGSSTVDGGSQEVRSIIKLSH